LPFALLCLALRYRVVVRLPLSARFTKRKLNFTHGNRDRNYGSLAETSLHIAVFNRRMTLGFAAFEFTLFLSSYLSTKMTSLFANVISFSRNVNKNSSNYCSHACSCSSHCFCALSHKLIAASGAVDACDLQTQPWVAVLRGRRAHLSHRQLLSSFLFSLQRSVDVAALLSSTLSLLCFGCVCTSAA
jgi:hypothetical protein